MSLRVLALLWLIEEVISFSWIFTPCVRDASQVAKAMNVMPGGTATKLFLQARSTKLHSKVEASLEVSNREKSIDSVVTIHDDVFSHESCVLLDSEASAAGLGHRIFMRDSANLEKTSVLEQALNSYLEAIGDNSLICEYWCREDWKNIDAHIDADEFLYREKGELRFPITGHVLYLDVGSNVAGPTCLWHGPSSGTYDSMITVPAVQGRVLRFSGDMLHAVPRPPLRFVSGRCVNAFVRVIASIHPSMRACVLAGVWMDRWTGGWEAGCEGGPVVGKVGMRIQIRVRLHALPYVRVHKPACMHARARAARAS